MNIVIVGCGRVGARLAGTLDQAGHRVSVVDIQSAALRRLSPEFSGTAVVGTGVDEDVLKLAGIEEADAFFAVTNGDNTNLMAAQLAQKRFQTPQVAARVYDPVRAETYRRMGIYTVCPTTTIASLLLDSLSTS
ncbi:MAG TPA: TrkA family potassium uptake protein [Thermomicrobiales bacterium]|jgi:trk system potassium uptake protein TrkA|nr:TrkA family potassium uptake protein [Chloroflexota bacterium]HBY47270.1 TrkA family potassium uptake protein [Chloroflexota bacterium]HCG31003.1 TrkA family potassium uptake protein [Chloroflexota bacterium]HQZ88717.1 TrkA family potassium uptake protein [Thermomicrobiales bacterium]HRA32630.1 TrkA family potassium uptake protein [Thermomicrobiales bacterium]